METANVYLGVTDVTGHHDTTPSTSIYRQNYSTMAVNLVRVHLIFLICQFWIYAYRWDSWKGYYILFNENKILYNSPQILHTKNIMWKQMSSAAP